MRGMSGKDIPLFFGCLFMDLCEKRENKRQNAEPGLLCTI